MRLVLLNDTKLVVDNGYTSQIQERFAAFVLVLGIVVMYFFVSKVYGNIPLFGSGIIGHFLCTCWYFAPVITTFDKIQEKLVIEKYTLWNNQVRKYSLAQIKTVSYLKWYGVSYLVLTSNEHLYLSHAWNEKKSCQEVLNIIQTNFLR